MGADASAQRYLETALRQRRGLYPRLLAEALTERPGDRSGLDRLRQLETEPVEPCAYASTLASLMARSRTSVSCTRMSPWKPETGETRS